MSVIASNKRRKLGKNGKNGSMVVPDSTVGGITALWLLHGGITILPFQCVKSDGVINIGDIVDVEYTDKVIYKVMVAHVERSIQEFSAKLISIAMHA